MGWAPRWSAQFRRDERLSSLNEDLAKAGKTPSTVLLDYQVGELEDEIRDVVDSADVLDSEFSQDPQAAAGDNVPLAILSNYIPSRYEITADDLKSRGLYACLNALGVHLKIAHQQISARLMEEDEGPSC